MSHAINQILSAFEIMMLNLPDERSVDVVGADVFAQKFLALEHTLAVGFGALEEHSSWR